MKRRAIPKGWPIKGLRPAKSAAREAFAEAGARGRIGAKPAGQFTYDKLLDENGIRTPCEVKVFALLRLSPRAFFSQWRSRLTDAPSRGHIGPNAAHELAKR
jgi:hypothetical protein